MFKLNAIPIVNENDTTATSEIKYGDNDRLAARVAQIISANVLINLSDVDGLYKSKKKKKLLKKLKILIMKFCLLLIIKKHHMDLAEWKRNLKLQKFA